MFNGMMMTGAESAIPPPEPPEEDVVTVSGGSGSSFTASNADADAHLYLKFTSTGDAFVRKNSGSYVQVSASTDWVRPTTNAPSLYQIRFTSASGDTTYLDGTKAEDTWHDIVDSDFIMHIFDSSIFLGGKSATFTIEVRLDGGATLDSGEYTITADREDSS